MHKVHEKGYQCQMTKKPSGKGTGVAKLQGLAG